MAPKRGGKEVASTSGTKKPRYMAEESDDDFQDRVPCLAAWQVEEEEVSDTETSDDVSDTETSVDDELLCIKYGDIPSTLVQLFCDYLESQKLGLKAMAMRRIPIDRMKMPWRNEWNKIDCAVYAMRHMEVYMGQKVKDSDIDLKKDPRKQLRYLRVKYCRVLLTRDINIFRARNLDESKAAYNKTRVSNFDHFLDTFNKKQ